MQARRHSLRKRRKKCKQGQGNIKTWVLGLVTGVSLFSILGTTVILNHGREFDPNSLCNVNKAPPMYESFVIDLTSRWYSDDEPEFVRTAVLKRAMDVPVNGRLAVSVLAADDKGKVVMGTVFNKCRPDDGSGRSRATNNPRKMQKRYKEEYEGELVKALDGLGKMKDAKSSPLLERFATDGFFPPEGRLPAEKRRLTIISDLLQKSEGLDQYKKSYTFPSEEKAIVKGVKNSLKGIDVTVLLRDGKESKQFQTEKHREFWKKYFTDVAGAASYDVTTL